MHSITKNVKYLFVLTSNYPTRRCCNNKTMDRILSNLYFLLFSSFYFTAVFTGDLSSLIIETKENIISYMEYVDVEKGAILIESTYERTLPNKEYIEASVSFNKGAYINKNFMKERLEEQPTLVGEPPSALNKGRDSP